MIHFFLDILWLLHMLNIYKHALKQHVFFLDIILWLLCIFSTHAVSWRDMKVVNDHIYIVSEALDHGVQVIPHKQLNK